MTARIIDGKALAATVKQEIGHQVHELQQRHHAVRLDALLVGADGSAAIYARNQGKACQELGIEHVLHELPDTAGESDVAAYVEGLNHDPEVSAIMVYVPLPQGMNTERIQSLISVRKDVEGVNPANIGNVVYGRRSLMPCTALAVIEMIESTGIELPGAQCVCVGASNIVGKPVVVLLMRAEATVISTNVYTSRIESLTRTADVLVSAVGKPGLVTADMIKPGAVVIDVGISRVKGDDGKVRTVGDVAFDDVAEVAGWLSPVPGGVGPLTVAMLLRNTVDATRRHAGHRTTDPASNQAC
ncbi:MAG: bifunctional 5,10-methylenetetrahydrofolate dehydrogenase/5,10-methenyltetrahydrofolate cyclohydrolase [Planctomycetota bacterium]|jgi:methylenetetrahydrofolate dehydrogenase (NADP+)/methenyltetrahydrofolate cyclohydrolase